ncbi:MAG: NfeD family protein [Pseudomonadota bacterium]
MIAQIANQLGGWSWFIIGGVLLILELLMPAGYLLWLGIAAIAVGVLTFTIDLGLPLELVLFGLLSIVSVYIGRRYFRRQGDETTDAPQLNTGAESLVGRKVTLSEPLSGGRGRTKLGDTVWLIEGVDAPAGAQVEVVDTRGGTLLVEPVVR